MSMVQVYKQRAINLCFIPHSPPPYLPWLKFCLYFLARYLYSSLIFFLMVDNLAYLPWEKLQAKDAGSDACIDAYSFSFVPRKSVVKFCSSVYMKIYRSNYFFIV